MKVSATLFGGTAAIGSYELANAECPTKLMGGWRSHHFPRSVCSELSKTPMVLIQKTFLRKRRFVPRESMCNMILQGHSRTPVVRCVRMFNAGANLTTALFDVVVHKTYGLGVQAMCGRERSRRILHKRLANGRVRRNEHRRLGPLSFATRTVLWLPRGPAEPRFRESSCAPRLYRALDSNIDWT